MQGMMIYNARFGEVIETIDGPIVTDEGQVVLSFHVEDDTYVVILGERQAVSMGAAFYNAVRNGRRMRRKHRKEMGR